MKFTLHSLASATAALYFFALPAAHAIDIHTTDFIADETRTGFNGFESIPNDGTSYSKNGSEPYTEDGISVMQVNGDADNDIWVMHGYWIRPTGKSWYPDGGDYGYTTIMLSDGRSFTDVGMSVGTGGYGSSLVVYELLSNGFVVATGTSPLSSNYLGFSGGGFDTIRLRDNLWGSNSHVTNGTFQALDIDNIEIRSAVPEPGSLAMYSLGLLGLGLIRRRKA